MKSILNSNKTKLMELGFRVFTIEPDGCYETHATKDTEYYTISLTEDHLNLPIRITAIRRVKNKMPLRLGLGFMWEMQDVISALDTIESQEKYSLQLK